GKLVGDVCIVRLRRDRLFADVLAEQVMTAHTAKWRPAGDKFVACSAETVYVGPAIHGFAADLFRRHVAPRSHRQSLSAKKSAEETFSLHARGQGEVDDP